MPLASAAPPLPPFQHYYKLVCTAAFHGHLPTLQYLLGGTAADHSLDDAGDVASSSSAAATLSRQRTSTGSSLPDATPGTANDSADGAVDVLARCLAAVTAYGRGNGGALPAPLAGRQLPVHAAALGGSLPLVRWVLGGARGMYAAVGDLDALATVLDLACFVGAVDVCQWIHSLSPRVVQHRCVQRSERGRDREWDRWTATG